MTKALFVKASKVALAVGTILLAINQFDGLFGEAQISWLPAFLTYCVPFIVFLIGQKSGQQTGATLEEIQWDRNNP